MKILFLVKKSSEYGTYTVNSKSGLRNSARFVKDQLNQIENIKAKLEFCIDGNDVDNRLALYNPKICIIEALWITPLKMSELAHLHSEVDFIIRVHSKTPFLAMEGNAVSWIKAYNQIDNVAVSFNNLQTSKDFRDIGILNYYLPNIYNDIKKPIRSFENFFKKFVSDSLNKEVYNIGCFGAIRPFKNHLNQALASIKFVENKNAKLRFYINTGRLEQGGENVLKNIRALFKNTTHQLIELDWYKHEEFLEVIKQMDVCLQVSYTESFNIVAADVISQAVPIVVSKEIEWIKTNSIVDPNNVDEISEKIDHVLKYRQIMTTDNSANLYNYNQEAINIWREYLTKQ